MDKLIEKAYRVSFIHQITDDPNDNRGILRAKNSNQAKSLLFNHADDWGLTCRYIDARAHRAKEYDHLIKKLKHSPIQEIHVKDLVIWDWLLIMFIINIGVKEKVGIVRFIFWDN